MSNLAIVFICLGLGILFKRLGVFGERAHITLNDFVIYVSLPALSLLHIPQIEADWNLLVPISTAWIVFIVAALGFGMLGKQLGLSRATIGCLILCCGLFNSSFVGFPVIEALFGEEGLKIALLVDQPGSFVVLSTLGIITAAWYSSAETHLRSITKKLISFPPLIAFAFAVFLRVVGFKHTEQTTEILQLLGSTITPVALIAVGLQLQFSWVALKDRALWLGLGYRLILAPALLLVLFYGIFDVTGLPLNVSIMESAMAPMITGAIIASQYGLNPNLANNFIGIGIPLSFVTLAVWYQLLMYLA